MIVSYQDTHRRPIQIDQQSAKMVVVQQDQEEAAASKRMEFTTPFRATMNIY